MRLQLVTFASLDPKLACVSDYRALARWCVDALANIDRDFGLAVIGVFLALKCFDVPTAVDGVSGFGDKRTQQAP